MTLEIKHITSCPNPQTGQLQLFGLGTDNKVYAWSYQLDGWLPNCLRADQERVAKTTPAPANRQARRATKAAAGKRRK